MNTKGVFVNSVEVAPSEILTKEEINKLVQPIVGKNVFIEDIQKVIDSINNLYAEKGFVTARAFLPEQTVENGNIYIALTESKIGSISVQQNKWTKDGYITSRLPQKEGELFDIVELESEVLRKSKVMLEEKNIKVEFENSGEIDVFADDFYIEQVITNYITNAIKNIKEVNKKKIIKVTNELNEDKQIVRVKVFNTGDNIKEENLMRIWNRFYKVDESRNRADGGTGIGLSFVKAVMNNYEQDYGIINKEDGVEFFFDLKYTGLKM